MWGMQVVGRGEKKGKYLTLVAWEYVEEWLWVVGGVRHGGTVMGLIHVEGKYEVCGVYA